MKKCLIDAGPLIALFDKDDRYHKAITAFLPGFKERLVTSWAVITETLHMLDFNIQVQLDFLRWIERDALEIPILTKSHITRIIELTTQYADLPMDFADATLLILSDSEHIDCIISIDSDFYVYRNIRKKQLRNIFLDQS
ncbi:MAG: pilus assembly protein [Bacillota bacterium]